MATTKIEWTEKSWNPTTGCTQISPGCTNCYAKVMAKRLKAMGQAKYRDGFARRFHPEHLDEPKQWRKPCMVFVCSMSDLFHAGFSEATIRKVFKAMSEANHHTYQVLTKRSERMAEMRLPWAPHIWAGVTVESEDYLWRIDDLRKTGAAMRWLSLEPLLGPLESDLAGIDWVVVGGESGPRARPLNKKWVIDIRDQCVAAEVPFFFKQWGGRNTKQAGSDLDGRQWKQMPETQPRTSGSKRARTPSHVVRGKSSAILADYDNRARPQPAGRRR